MPASHETTPTRRRVSRETRQLLTAALLALVALWVLARIRFPDQPASPNPLPSLLSPLSPVPRFSNLASEVADLQGRLSGSWLAVSVSAQSNETGEMTPRMLPAIRLLNDNAIVLLRRGETLDRAAAIAVDRATGLTVIRAGAAPSTPSMSPWVPSSLDTPHYLMATTATPAGIVLGPVLVGSLRQIRSPAWSGAIWALPEGTSVQAGSFLFATGGELAGLVVHEAIGAALVPGEVVLADAARLLARGDSPAEDLRVEVQPLTPALTKATGTAIGVVVTYVDPQGPANGHLMVGDVIEALNGIPVSGMREWEVSTGRLSAGKVAIRVRRRGDAIDVPLTLAAPEAPAPPGSLGLSLRGVPGSGAAVARVERGSAADAARLQEGDIITLAGDINAPTPAQIRDAFAAANPGEAILLALTRGRTHHVVALVK